MKKKMFFKLIAICIPAVFGLAVLLVVNNIITSEHFIRINTVKRVTVRPAELTGAVLEKVIVDEKTQQISKLIDTLPIVTQAFSMNMDYVNNRIVVAVNTPSTNNYPIFQQWLSENGYTKIPQEKFVIKYQ